MDKYLGKKYIAVPLAVLCTLLWGTAFPVIKKCYGIMHIEDGAYGSQILFAGVRFFAAGIITLIIGSAAKKSFVKIRKNEILPIFALGLVQISAQYLLSYIGLAHTSGTKTSVITSMSAFLSVLLSPVFFREDRLTVRKILGCIIGFAGIAAINAGGLGSSFMLGDALVALSAVAAAGGGFICKKISADKSFFTVSAYHLLSGGAILIICGGAMGGELAYNGVVPILLTLYLALVSSAAFTVWTALLRCNPVSEILVFNLLIPVFGTIWSFILLHENNIHTETFISLILITIGIISVNSCPSLKRRRRDEN